MRVMGCCCEQKLTIGFSSPLKIVMVDEEEGASYLTVTPVTHAGFSLTARGDIMYQLPVGMGVKMQVSYTDAGGNKAEVDDVAWQTSDSSILAIQTDDDDTTICVVQTTGKIGQVQVTAVADADLGTGVKNIVTIADISVIAGEAVAGTIAPVGEPIPNQPVQQKKK